MLVLDSGALVAIDKRDRQVGAMLEVARHQGVRVSTSAAVVAQVWRPGAMQANLARALQGVRAVPRDVTTRHAVRIAAPRGEARRSKSIGSGSRALQGCASL